MFCKKLDNFKNKPAGLLLTFYDHMPTLPASDDITRFDGTVQPLRRPIENLKGQTRIAPCRCKRCRAQTGRPEMEKTSDCIPSV